MRLPILFIILSCLACIGTARAEDAPPAPSGPVVVSAAPSAPAPAPQPGAPAAVQPAPVARKEEDETAPAANTGWSLKNLGAYLKSKGTLAESAAEKDRQIAALTARITALESGAELQAARDEAARLRADLEGFALYAQTHGLLKEDGSAAPAPQTPAGQAAGAAVASAVSRNLSSLGVPVSQLPASAAKGADVSDEAINAVIEQMEASKDAGERGRLAEKLKTMRAAQKAGQN